MKKRFTEEQIIGFLREADAGLSVKELFRKHGFSAPSYYAWKAKFGGMNVSDAQRLKALEVENTKLKKLLANSMLEVDAMRELRKQLVACLRHGRSSRLPRTRGENQTKTADDILASIERCCLRTSQAGH
jgi:putative transposase